MVLSTVLNLFFIPVLYVILKTILANSPAKPRPTGEQNCHRRNPATNKGMLNTDLHRCHR